MLRRNGEVSWQSSLSGYTIACIRFGRDRVKRECGKLKGFESRSMIWTRVGVVLMGMHFESVEVICVLDACSYDR